MTKKQIAATVGTLLIALAGVLAQCPDDGKLVGLPAPTAAELPDGGP